MFNFSPSALNIDQVSAFKDIINITQEEGVKLVIVTTPITDIMMSTNRNYRDINRYFMSYSKRYGIEYIDYNVENLEFTDTVDFYDFQHLNQVGARKVNHHFSSRLEKVLER